MFSLFKKCDTNLLIRMFLLFWLFGLNIFCYYVVFVFHIASFLKIAIVLAYLIISSNLLAKVYILWLKK